MIDWKKEYKKKFILDLILIFIYWIAIVILSLNIEKRDDKIWQLEIENKDLKEQIYQLERCINNE